MTTDVVPEQDKEILGKCEFCFFPTENYYSDDTVRPSKKVLACDSCYTKEKSHLRGCNEKIEKQSLTI